MDVLSTQLEKARIFAYFGFVGIFFPIIGIVSGCVSISILNRLSVGDDDKDVAEEKERLLTLANAACAISVVILIISFMFAIYGATKLGEAIVAQNQAMEALEELTGSAADLGY